MYLGFWAVYRACTSITPYYSTVHFVIHLSKCTWWCQSRGRGLAPHPCRKPNETDMSPPHSSNAGNLHPRLRRYGSPPVTSRIEVSCSSAAPAASHLLQ